MVWLSSIENSTFVFIFSDIILYCKDHHEESTLFSHDGQIVFTMETLLIATKNFDDENKLGEGGFGPVYKVT